MIDPRAANIEYQSVTSLLTLVEQLVDNERLGKAKPQLWDKAFCVIRYLNTTLRKNDMSKADQKRLTALYECLLQILNINSIPTAPGLINFTVPTLTAGIPGPAGPAGASNYLYFAWADDTAGTGFTTTYNPAKPFIAFIQSSSPILVLTAGLFTGLWIRIIGVNGVNGTNGTNGTNGINGLDGRTILNDTVNPTSPDGEDGDFWINTATSTLFGPKAAGAWPSGVSLIGAAGANGANGTNGNTILSGIGAPGGGTGVNGDFYINLSTFNIYGPKAAGIWPAGVPLIGATGATGANGATGATGADGDDAYVYIAWADDALGTGFTTIFDPAKTYIGIIQSTTEIVTPVVGDFTGFFAKYRGDGDRWTTSSTTSLTIGTGVQVLIVEHSLAYITGQRALIAVPGDPTLTMKGTVISYDYITGQLLVDVDIATGSGTYAVWDVSLESAISALASSDGFYGTISVENNVSTQALSTTPAKITAFDTVIAESISMTADTADNDITVANGGAYILDFNADVLAGTVNLGYIFQIFRNGTVLPGFQTVYTQNNIAGDLYETVSIHGVFESATDGDVFDVRVSSSSGTPDITIRNARFNVYTVGASPITEEYFRFENSDIDIGTEVVDSFSATGVSAAEFKYMIKKGANYRAGVVIAVWDGSTVEHSDIGTVAIGTVDVTLDVDINAGNVRLLATATSDDWFMSGVRTIIG